MSLISMPLACISCDHYNHIGWRADEQSPYKENYSSRSKNRTQYGNCSKHNCQVFGTQVCSSHQFCDKTMKVHVVVNRKDALESIQESLI
ncbi:hypothetical protein [Glaciecola sp. KUL10]|uniref:hypothetical protein n=1 Tax=Glaciecola sp. (strain KUL10) TaxID=2161813 RepID=UPI000D7880EB|nr:hypothetical protein [Glaciecola sp. KUL10]GBL02960.1 hypothetical protein KUL10_02330 [Glaciecola sp. KUL10]